MTRMSRRNVKYSCQAARFPCLHWMFVATCSCREQKKSLNLEFLTTFIESYFSYHYNCVPSKQVRCEIKVRRNHHDLKKKKNFILFSVPQNFCFLLRPSPFPTKISEINFFFEFSSGEILPILHFGKKLAYDGWDLTGFFTSFVHSDVISCEFAEKELSNTAMGTICAFWILQFQNMNALFTAGIKIDWRNWSTFTSNWIANPGNQAPSRDKTFVLSHIKRFILSRHPD